MVNKGKKRQKGKKAKDRNHTPERMGELMKIVASLNEAEAETDAGKAEE